MGGTTTDSDLYILTVLEIATGPEKKNRSRKIRKRSAVRKYKSTIVLADLPSDVNNQNTFSVNGGALSGL